jgi:predicted  nucleic acid-binding Zn-ribbon protein
MTDINTRLETIDQRLDRITTALDSMLNVQENTRRRVQQHDLELDEQDQRTELLERNHLEHSSRMAKLEEIQADMKTMLEILLRRSIGEQ